MKQLILSLLALVLVVCTINSQAQERLPMQGEIELESYDIVEDTTPNQRALTIELIKNLAKQLESLGKGSVSKVSPMSTQDDESSPAVLSNFAAHHLALAYLRCSVAEGTCPQVLDVIFEIDLINSKINKNANCANMQRFWKTWLDNDMEKRQQHQVQIGYLKDTENFNRDIRPKYIKCKDTVANLIAEQSDPSEFFKKRYVSPAVSNAINSTIKLLEALEKTNDAAFDLKR